MFFSHSLLARKGSLGKVWLAAHWDKKLNKQTILQTDIKATVGECAGRRGEGRAQRRAVTRGRGSRNDCGQRTCSNGRSPRRALTAAPTSPFTPAPPRPSAQTK